MQKAHESVTPEDLANLITATDVLATHLGHIKYDHEDDERIANYLAQQVLKHAIDLEGAYGRRSFQTDGVAGYAPTN